MRVVVVEDHLDLRQVFVDALIHEGMDVLAVSCAEELDECMSAGMVHLLVLDVNLPGESGFDIAKRMRAADPKINIIMLSARTSETDRIRGYESGADFYLCKPVSPAELSAAVKAVKRRVSTPEASVDDLALSVSGMCLTSGHGVANLSRMDVSLLKALAMAPDHRLPYWRLFEVTERSANELAKNQLELQVYRLRKKLADIDIPESLIKSMRSEGYQLTQAIRIDP
ncbi:MAG: response regulator transcription factor [Zwartia sp.]|uniref:response regulator transcription factor n=1 Tax=Zwartia sp. TaxID=2978004 RepID=UPI003BE86A78